MAVRETPHSNRADAPGNDLPGASLSEVPTQPRERLWTPLFIFILISTLCCFIVCQGYNAGTTVYLSLKDMGTEVAGVLMVVYSITAAATRLICGPILDTRGRYAVAIVGTLILLASTVIPLLLPGIIPLVVCRALQGIGFSSATTATSTMTADIVPSSRLGEGIGYGGLAQALAMTVGPALSFALLSTPDPNNFFYGLFAITAVALVFVFFCRYEKHPEMLTPTSAYRMRSERPAATTQQEIAEERESLLSRIFEKRALPGALPALAMSGVYGFAIVFAGLYGTQIGVGNAGLFYTVAAIGMIATRMLSGRFMDTVAPIRILAVATAGGCASMALLGASYLCVGTVAASLLFYAAGLFYGICNGLCVPLNISIAVKCTPPQRWGAANSLAILANDIGYGLGSMIWGFTCASFGYPITFALVAACAIAALAIGAKLYPHE